MQHHIEKTLKTHIQDVFVIKQVQRDDKYFVDVFTPRFQALGLKVFYYDIEQANQLFDYVLDYINNHKNDSVFDIEKSLAEYFDLINHERISKLVSNIDDQNT